MGGVVRRAGGDNAGLPAEVLKVAAGKAKKVREQPSNGNRGRRWTCICVASGSIRVRDARGVVALGRHDEQLRVGRRRAVVVQLDGAAAAGLVTSISSVTRAAFSWLS
ncbi:hypothetical protein ACDA63_18545 [Uliginosibacterium sp. sgz301328]|uniref:hypothetical protein n=1 Tax=Uliginosibacterium sp. sgz301328 TaxID=3243764 RepID=UPI00359DB260